MKKGYVGIHSSGFKDFLLKPELLRAIQDCGFEHPSEGEFGACSCKLPPPAAALLPPPTPVSGLSCAVQHECIPQAILGMDVICQAKSGMGKTAVFVISTLQQLEPVDGQVRRTRQPSMPEALLPGSQGTQLAQLLLSTSAWSQADALAATTAQMLLAGAAAAARTAAACMQSTSGPSVDTHHVSRTCRCRSPWWCCATRASWPTRSATSTSGSPHT